MIAYLFLAVAVMSFLFMVYAYATEPQGDFAKCGDEITAITFAVGDVNSRLTYISNRLAKVELLKESVAILNRAVFENRPPLSKKGEGQAALIRKK